MSITTISIALPLLQMVVVLKAGQTRSWLLLILFNLEWSNFQNGQLWWFDIMLWDQTFSQSNFSIEVTFTHESKSLCWFFQPRFRFAGEVLSVRLRIFHFRNLESISSGPNVTGISSAILLSLEWDNFIVGLRKNLQLSNWRSSFSRKTKTKKLSF